VLSAYVFFGHVKFVFRNIDVRLLSKNVRNCMLAKSDDWHLADEMHYCSEDCRCQTISLIYRFEFCYGRYVQQFHDDKRTGRTTITVGTWDEEDHQEWAESNRAVVHKQTKVGILWSINKRGNCLLSESSEAFIRFNSSFNCRLEVLHDFRSARIGSGCEYNLFRSPGVNISSYGNLLHGCWVGMARMQSRVWSFNRQSY